MALKALQGRDSTITEFKNDHADRSLITIEELVEITGSIEKGARSGVELIAAAEQWFKGIDVEEANVDNTTMLAREEGVYVVALGDSAEFALALFLQSNRFPTMSLSVTNRIRKNSVVLVQ